MATTSAASMASVDQRDGLLARTEPGTRDRVLSLTSRKPLPSRRAGHAAVAPTYPAATGADAPGLIPVNGRGSSAPPSAKDGQVLKLGAARPALVPMPIRHNLPDQPTRLFDRERETETISAHLRDEAVRLVTLTGTGGVGKTRLAVAVAEAVLPAFPGGVWFVDLARIDRPALVLPTIARELDLRDNVGHNPHKVLVAHLQHDATVLVLDNFEHLLPAAGEIEALSSACPRLKLLVTSREPLHLRREHVVEVEPLPVPAGPWSDAAGGNPTDFPSVALFVERAQAADASFALTERNLAAVVELCRRLDGVPLAIELAAARVRYVDPAALLARLDHRLSLLRWKAHDLPARQRSLQAALDWSHDALAPEERVVFRRLGAFAGGFTLEAAAEVVDAAGLGVESFEVLASLADKHLLRVERGSGEPRFGLLDTIRAYALAQLDAADETDAVRDRHLACYLRLAEVAKPELTGPAQAAWLDRLQTEHDNLRAALARASGQASNDAEARLVAALRRFWLSRGHLREGFAQLEAALARGPWTDPVIELEALEGAGALALWLRSPAPAKAYLERGFALASATDNQRFGARLHAHLGMVRFVDGDADAARQHTDQSLAMARKSNAAWEVAYTFRNRLLLASSGPTSTREMERLRPDAEEAVAIFRRLGDVRNLAMSLAGLGWVMAPSDPRAAVASLRESVDLARRLDDEIVTDCLCWRFTLLLLEHLPPSRIARLVGSLEGIAARANAAGYLGYSFAFATTHTRDALRRAAEAAKRELGETSYAAAVAAARDGANHPLDEIAAALDEAEGALVAHAASPRPATGDGLVSGREHEVLSLVAEGLSNKDIAERLFIAPTTAKFHVTSLLNKLGADTRAQLVAIAAQRGLLA